MSYEIKSDKHLRISRSGLDIRMGWSHEKRVLFVCPIPANQISQRAEEYKQWLEIAEWLCGAWNDEVELYQGSKFSQLPESLRDPEKVLERGQQLLAGKSD